MLAPLVVVPFFRIVPERVGILTGIHAVAEQGAQARAVEPFSRVVVQVPTAVEHEQRRIQPHPGFGCELGEPGALQALARLEVRSSPQQDVVEASAQQRALEKRIAAGIERGLVGEGGQRADRRQLRGEPPDEPFDAGPRVLWALRAGGQRDAAGGNGENPVRIGQLVGLIEFVTRKAAVCRPIW